MKLFKFVDTKYKEVLVGKAYFFNQYFKKLKVKIICFFIDHQVKTNDDGWLQCTRCGIREKPSK